MKVRETGPHDRANFIYDRHYLGIERSDAFVVVQIALRRGRTTEAKQALDRGFGPGLQLTPTHGNSARRAARQP